MNQFFNEMEAGNGRSRAAKASWKRTMRDKEQHIKRQDCNQLRLLLLLLA